MTAPVDAKALVAALRVMAVTRHVNAGELYLAADRIEAANAAISSISEWTHAATTREKFSRILNGTHGEGTE